MDERVIDHLKRLNQYHSFPEQMIPATDIDHWMPYKHPTKYRLSRQVSETIIAGVKLELVENC